MTNCVFANVVWGWSLFDPDDPNKRSQALRDYQERRDALAIRLSDWEESATEQHGESMQRDGDYLWPAKWREIQSADDLDGMPGMLDQLDDDQKAELEALVLLCSELRVAELAVITELLQDKGLTADIADHLYVFVVGEGDDGAFAGSGCQDDEILVGVGVYGLHYFCLDHTEIARQLSAAGANYYQWVT